METMTVNDFLAHYGVKGMKWGVRKDRAQLRRAAKTYTKNNKKADRLQARAKRVDKRVASARQALKDDQAKIDRIRDGKLTTDDMLSVIGGANIYTALGAAVNRQSYRKQYASDLQKYNDNIADGVNRAAARNTARKQRVRQLRAGANKAEAILKQDGTLTLTKP